MLKIHVEAFHKINSLKVFKMIFTYLFYFFLLNTIWISPSDALTHDNGPSKEITMKSKNEYKPISVEAACTNQTIMGIITFRTPFNGLLYANGHPNDPCIAQGNGTKQIRLALPTNQCGISHRNRTDGKKEIKVLIYLQHDRKLLKAYDEIFNLQCAPSNISINMSVKNYKNPPTSKTSKDNISFVNQHIPGSNFSETYDVESTNKSSFMISRQWTLNGLGIEPANISFVISVTKLYVGPPENSSRSEETLSVEASHRQQLVSSSQVPSNKSNPVQRTIKTSEVESNVLKGVTDPLMKIFFIKNPEKYGEDLQHSRNVQTLSVQIQLKHSRSINGKITNCSAYDQDGILLNLTDSNGDSLDETIMPNFSETYDDKTLTKTAFSKFSIIEFPHSQGVKVNCSYKINWDFSINNCSNTSHEKIRVNNQKRGIELEENLHFGTATQNYTGSASDNGNKAPKPTEKKALPMRNYSFQIGNYASSSDENHKADFLNATLEYGLGKCLSSVKIIAMISFLLSFLVVSLVVTICMCVKSREMKRRLMARNSYFMKTAQYHP